MATSKAKNKESIKPIWSLLDPHQEPTDEQLAEVMRLAGNDVRSENIELQRRHKKKLAQGIQQAVEEWKTQNPH